jgi:hypothetical protein
MASVPYTAPAAPLAGVRRPLPAAPAPVGLRRACISLPANFSRRLTTIGSLTTLVLRVFAVKQRGASEMKVRLIVGGQELRLRSMRLAANWLNLTDEQEAAMRKALRERGEWQLDSPAVLVLKGCGEA